MTFELNMTWGSKVTTSNTWRRGGACALYMVHIMWTSLQEIDDDPVDPPFQSSPVSSSSSSDRKDTQKKVLMQLQSIFAHLMDGKLQFHTPEGFWREFR